MLCHQCQTSLENVIPERGSIPRYALCPQCHSEVRVCLNCQHYDPSYYNECRESAADRVKDKEKSNFCEYFSPANQKKQKEKENKIQKTKQGFNDLFK